MQTIKRIATYRQYNRQYGQHVLLAVNALFSAAEGVHSNKRLAVALRRFAGLFLEVAVKRSYVSKAALSDDFGYRRVFVAEESAGVVDAL